jgi:hypothetical protein
MCNSDRRDFLRRSIVTLAAVGIAGAAFAADPEPKKGKVYVCPPCGCAADGKEFPAPGACPECGMPLVEKGAAPAQLSVQGRSVSNRAPASSKTQISALRRL